MYDTENATLMGENVDHNGLYIQCGADSGYDTRWVWVFQLYVTPNGRYFLHQFPRRRARPRYKLRIARWWHRWFIADHPYDRDRQSILVLSPDAAHRWLKANGISVDERRFTFEAA
jgi:hypothetical protein